MNNQEWIDGIPFLGCDCFASFGDGSAKDKIVYRGLTKKGKHIVEWEAGHVSSYAHDKITFYPIRTPEEIERVSAIRVLMEEDSHGCLLYIDCERIYDAGYRKQGEVVDYIQVYDKFIKQTGSSLEYFFDRNYIITRKEKS
jgi:hypothetical protein